MAGIKGYPKAMVIVFCVLLAILLAEAAFVLTKGTAKNADNESETTEVPMVEKLSIKGTTLVNESGDTVVFKGMSFGWHNIWPRFYNGEAVRNLHEQWGCNLFRAAIGADSHAKADNPDIHDGYMGEPEFALQCAYNVIDAAIENGCYVIVDWHSHVIHTEEAKEFFTKIATKYKGVPNVIYELFNEPVCTSFEESGSYDDLSDQAKMEDYWKKLKVYADELIQTITSIDDSHPLILMGAPSWDQRMDIPAADPIESYDNLMYTMHFYAATHGPWLRETTDAAIEAGIPVFISECAAVEASGDGFLDKEAWEAYDSWAASRNISRVVWSVSDKDESCSMLTKQATSEGPWDESVLKEWGKIVKDWIK